MEYKIRELVKYSIAQYSERGPINIAICGDSISHGGLNGEIDYNTVYHNRLRIMINKRWQNVPVNIINTAVGGKCADHAVRHFERDVTPLNPDLVIICFGLNDVNNPIENWCQNLSDLFDKCNEHGFECVFMTPNMLNTYVAEGTPEQYLDYAHVTADMQNNGTMDAFMDEARRIAAEKGIEVCDCYAAWKKMAAEGVDTTLLLANLINHPTREMHRLFAGMLYETIFGERYTKPSTGADNDMYQKAN